MLPRRQPPPVADPSGEPHDLRAANERAHARARGSAGGSILPTRSKIDREDAAGLADVGHALKRALLVTRPLGAPIALGHRRAMVGEGELKLFA
jgi:hypothetical protein